MVGLARVGLPDYGLGRLGTILTRCENLESTISLSLVQQPKVDSFGFVWIRSDQKEFFCP